MPRAKRHHQVPRFYLARFAEGGLVRVVRRDGGDFNTNPENVAVESGFYDVPESSGAEIDAIEKLFARIEGFAKVTLDEIDATGVPPAVGSDERDVLALFVAIQMARTTDERERAEFPGRVLEWIGTRELTHELIAEYLEREHLGFAPEEHEVKAAFVYVWAHRQAPDTLTREWALDIMREKVPELTRRVADLHWTVEHDRRHAFITSDSPVVAWRRPSPQDDLRGIGIATASELRFPLDPSKQLVLSTRERAPRIDVAQHRVRRSNGDLAGAAHRFVVGNPAIAAPLSAVKLAARRPVLRFASGRGWEQQPDGSRRLMDGEIVQMWVPRSASHGRGARGGT